MKTNASPKSVIQAVETVSKEKYDDNVVFMNFPKKITKYVTRFTLRTKDVDGPGSMVTKAGQKQPKANWQVQEDVMEEILRINPYPNIYVDTIYGRKFSTGQDIPEDTNTEPEEELESVGKEEKETRIAHAEKKPHKRAYRSRKSTKKPEKPTARKKSAVIPAKAKLLKAIKYVLKHPELLD